MTGNGKNPDEKPDHASGPPLVYSGKGGAPIVPGNPGNSGGKKGRSGTHPRVARALSCEGYVQAVPMLRRIVRGKVAGATIGDRIRAAEVLGRFGLAGAEGGMDVADVRDRLQRSLDEIRRLCPGEPGQAISDALRPLWQGAPR